MEGAEAVNEAEVSGFHPEDCYVRNHRHPRNGEFSLEGSSGPIPDRLLYHILPRLSQPKELPHSHGLALHSGVHRADVQGCRDGVRREVCLLAAETLHFDVPPPWATSQYTPRSRPAKSPEQGVPSPSGSRQSPEKH